MSTINSCVGECDGLVLSDLVCGLMVRTTLIRT